MGDGNSGGLSRQHLPSRIRSRLSSVLLHTDPSTPATLAQAARGAAAARHAPQLVPNLCDCRRRPGRHHLPGKQIGLFWSAAGFAMLAAKGLPAVAKRASQRWSAASFPLLTLLCSCCACCAQVKEYVYSRADVGVPPPGRSWAAAYDSTGAQVG